MGAQTRKQFIEQKKMEGKAEIFFILHGTFYGHVTIF
jgi:hypothetical protein